jgi:hypothetical protein
VAPLVAFQIALADEPGAALGIGAGMDFGLLDFLLTQVSHLVATERLLGSKLEIALIALEILGPFVDLAVLVEVALLRELLGACVAGVRLLSRVHSHVIQQVAAHEHLVAQSAGPLPVVVFVWTILFLLCLRLGFAGRGRSVEGEVEAGRVSGENEGVGTRAKYR